MSVLVCDIGGTHIRFFLTTMQAPVKTRVRDHKDLQSAIQDFLQSQSMTAGDIGKFYFAFSNRNEWKTDIEALKICLPNASIKQINDFEANAYGVLASAPDDVMLLNAPIQKRVGGAAKVVLGVGTGLGLAYIFADHGKDYVQRTHGGHMVPARSVQHEDLFRYIEERKNDALIFEDILSGRGLFTVYEYLCHINHLDREYSDIETLMVNGKDDVVFRQALHIFYEVLGLFMHQAVAFGCAYGGVYLTGGVIDRLMIAGLFDLDVVNTTYKQRNVPIVVTDVDAAPVYWLKDEFISLRGLLNLAEGDHA